MSDNDNDTSAAVAQNEGNETKVEAKSDGMEQKSKGDTSNKKRKKDWFLRRNRNRNKTENIPAKKRRGPDKEERVEQPPHEGSYANSKMQELYGVKIDKPKSSDVESSQENDDSDGANRVPKRKVAMLLAFVGENYSGFQMNPETKTIQAQVELALYRAGLLSDTNFGHPHKYSWSSSARTDKGVHACAHVLSVKIGFPPSLTTDDLRTRTNAHLPDDILVLDVVRTTRKFCARTQRDHVRYQYMLPSFMLYDRKALRQLMESHNCHENGRSPSDPLSQDEVGVLRKEFVKFRAPHDRVERLRDALGMYVGTHLFHNFTSGKTSEDGSSQRYIMSFDMKDPVVMQDGTEWIITQVTGQAFLFNQIRKMISLAVDVARGSAEPNTLREALSDQPTRIGVAPAQGLFLDMSFFDRYNRQKQSNDNLDWSCSTSTPAIDRWKEFKESVVMPHILKEEARDGNFIKYLFIQEYIFDSEKFYGLQEEPTIAETKGKNENGES